MDPKELLELMRIAVNADRSTSVAFSYQDKTFSLTEVNDLVREELQALGGNYALYRANKNTIFELIEKTIDDVLPARVLEQYGQFAEVQTLAQGDKAIFTQRITNAAKMRAKQFVTKVGLAGIYETFKLDGKSVEITTTAYGGAASIGLEEFLDGRVSFADVLDIVLAGLDEAIYRAIAEALTASIAALPAANKVVASSFDETAMDSLVAVANAYGTASIFCTYEFATTMVPAEGWVSESHKDTMWTTGYIANYKGTRVIVLPQSFEDDTNAVKVIDPAYAWVIPAGAAKPVKIAFEGDSIVREFENKDGSKEIHIYKKLGIATMITNNICSYKNTSLSKTQWVDTDANGS